MAILSNNKRKIEKVGLDLSTIEAALFDMDGVVTKTSKMHAQAWKETFDSFLKKRFGKNYSPFDIDSDYLLYLDGRTRFDGTAGFLKSREIELVEGNDCDQPGFNSIHGISLLKDKNFQTMVKEKGVECYPSTINLIERLLEKKIKVGLVSASENALEVLRSAQVIDYFETIVDGKVIKEKHLNGKPNPDPFLEAARILNVLPEKTIVFEDAASGVEAGARGGFITVIGLNRGDNAELLKSHGADIVVEDLSQINFEFDSNNSENTFETSLEDVSNWNLEFDYYNPKEEGKREALSAIGNGYFVARGSDVFEKANLIHYPGTYVAGLYNRTSTNTGELIDKNEDLVNLPNFLRFNFSIKEGNWFSIDDVEILSYKHSLNLKEGILEKQITFRDQQSRETSICEKRFVHMRHFHLAGQHIEFKPLNWSGNLKVQSIIDGDVENKGTKQYRLLNGKHLQILDLRSENEHLFLESRLSQSKVIVAISSRTSFCINGVTKQIERKNIVNDKSVAQEFNLEVKQNDKIEFEKISALYTSRDWGISEPGEASIEAITEAPEFSILLEDQKEEWRHLWEKFELKIETEDQYSQIPASLVLRLHSFHILQTISPNSIDLDCGIPARGWTGEAYRGHVFWDELFVFPFLNLRMPEVAKAVLRYRYRRLDEAKNLAREMGAFGARFPWESASSGQEETPKYSWQEKTNCWAPIRTNLQIHVNAAIAFNIWQYYQVTGDLHSIYTYGAEMLFEIARFYASYAKFDQTKERYVINQVAGPDEFHTAYPDSEIPGINNNAYTNIMAAWTISRALDLLNNLPVDHRKQLCEKLNLYKEEISVWEAVSRNMYIPIQKSGIINQFDGYENLLDFPYHKNEKIDLSMIEKILDQQGGHLNQYKISKQADVLMLFYVFSAEELQDIFNQLGYEFPMNTIPKNINYYMNQTINYSTLSRVTHAWVLSRLDRPRSWAIISQIFPAESEVCGPGDDTIIPKSLDIFLEALSSDYNDIQGGTTCEGIHIGAMSGTIDIIQRGYTGIVTRDDVLWFNPYLPDGIKTLSFNINYRSQSIRFEISRQTVNVIARHSSAESVNIGFLNHVYSISSGENLLFDINKGALVKKSIPEVHCD